MLSQSSKYDVNRSQTLLTIYHLIFVLITLISDKSTYVINRFAHIHRIMDIFYQSTDFISFPRIVTLVDRNYVCNRCSVIIAIDFLDRTLFQNTFQIFHCLLLFIKTIYFKEIEIIQIDSIAIMPIQILGICSAILFPILYVAIRQRG